MKNIDLLIIGGGSAGMAAAIQAKKEGIDNLLIIEKDDCLGGILNQCIHNGFGLHEFKEELTGPEYLYRFVKQVEKLEIHYLLNTLALQITPEKVVTISNCEGVEQLKCKSIIFAAGCFERTASMIELPGDRCAGIITAGTAQKLVNIHGYNVGKKIVILGSGDIGLIMARRLVLEGANVLCVCELMHHSNGLKRNIVQCLDDFNIPLYLGKTVIKAIGKNRLEKVILAKVDENLKPIPGTEEEVECDTLILSVGLVPYYSILKNIQVPIGPYKGPLVDEYMQTQVEGVFACGNALHVHDIVDYVTDESRLAGHGAAMYLKGLFDHQNNISVTPKEGVSYVVPQTIKNAINEDITLKFRVNKPYTDVNIIISDENRVILKRFKPVLIPSEMEMIKIKKEYLEHVSGEITIKVEAK